MEPGHKLVHPLRWRLGANSQWVVYLLVDATIQNLPLRGSRIGAAELIPGAEYEQVYYYYYYILTQIEPKAMRDICVNTGENPLGKKNLL